NRFIPAQKRRRLLVLRRTLKVAIVEIVREKRLPRFHPLVVVRPRKTNPRLPMTSNSAKAGGPGPIAPRTDLPVWILDVRQPKTGRVLTGHRNPGSHWVSPLPVALRMLGSLIHTPKRPLIGQRHLHERLRRRDTRDTPLPIARDTQHLPHRPHSKADLHPCGR